MSSPHWNTCVHSVLSVYQPESPQEAGGTLQWGNLRRVGKCGVTSRESVQDPWATKSGAGGKGRGRLCYQVLESLCTERLNSVTFGKEPQTGHTSLLPADTPQCPPH